MLPDEMFGAFLICIELYDNSLSLLLCFKSDYIIKECFRIVIDSYINW